MFFNKHSFILWFFIITTYYFTLCSFIKWFKYNHAGKLTIFILYLVSSLSIIFAIGQNTIIDIMFGCLLFLCAPITIILSSKLKIDWGKFYSDMLYLEGINCAGRHRDYIAMQRITSEHLSKKKHAIKIYHFPLNNKNAVFYKALIELFRINQRQHTG